MDKDTLQKKYFVQIILEWSSKYKRDFEWRKNRNPYRIFVAELLLKRTTSKAATRVFHEFITKYPDIFALADADIDGLKLIIKPIGLYEQRSKGLVRAARCLVNTFKGEFPRSKDQLLSIPHVGEYTAGCILSFGMGIPSPVVDSNVQRVLSRVFCSSVGDKPSIDSTIKLAQTLIPKGRHVDFNYALIDFGAVVCTYRGCYGDTCPLKDICDIYFMLKNHNE
ncbi:hypothetical protein [Methanofollis sp. UBA420]|jgi:A/G-specific adenine glycosylase|uniref:hypothetical protein n=1 Tax=Methanofollis sp. UBA420 TaxID=1915514 RepID=UPI00316AEC88